MEDLASAQISISVFKSQILFYQTIIQSIIDKLKEILELLKLVDNTSGLNKDITELETKLNKVIQDQQQTQETLTRKLLESEFVQTNKPYYAARIIK